MADVAPRSGRTRKRQVQEANLSALTPVVSVHGTINDNWQEVAETALKFVGRLVA